MTRPEIAALADELCDTALRAVRHVGLANYAEREVEAKQWVRNASDKLNVALRASATSPADAVRALQSIAALSVEKGHTIASAQQIANAALAPAEKAGDDEGFGSVRGKLDHLGRRVDAVDMPQALKDSIARCYGLLWMLETEDKRAHRARRGLLSWLTKDEQVWGIENAKAICLMNGLDDGSSQKDCTGTATPTPPGANGAPNLSQDTKRGTTLDAARGTPPSANVAELLKACRNILPYLRWTIGPESPGHHPTMPSAVGAFEHALNQAVIQSAAPGGGTKSDGLVEGSLPSGESEPLVTAASAPSDPAQEPEAVAWRATYANGETFLLTDKPTGDSGVYRCEALYTRPVSLDLEAVARIVDPEAFIIPNSKRFEVKSAQQAARAKARAIIALIEGRT